MKIYFVGIGGIGMSALAQLHLSRGEEVLGSDREASPVTEMLEKKGVRVIIGQNAQNITDDIDLVIYSDAVPENNPERTRAAELGVKQVTYFEALGEVSQNMNTVAVAGTHGKTTTTAMLTKILKDAGENPTAIIGSIVSEFGLHSSQEAVGRTDGTSVLGSNFVEGGDVFVVEACEYKDHLLKLNPKVLVITNLEWDHTDWFPNFEAMQASFKKAIDKIPEDGAIVTDPNHPAIAPLLKDAKAKVVDYTKELAPELKLIGEFNKENARAAKAAARAVNNSFSEEATDAALSEFKGTWRRFEYLGETEHGAMVYDDYAHHPTAVQKTLKAIRAKYPENKVVVAFHPHLYSRTRDFMDEFADSFSDADCVMVAPIYAAREEPIEGVTNEALSEKIKTSGTDSFAPQSFDEVEQLLREKYNQRGNVLLTMGAGDVVKVAHKITKN